ncbi:hypothetical protein FBU59_005963 [Linderina macrospora]|uniref:Uncharacterized protein n=1 Tax=Linderina macrospora TaxID=4868 RepID=A0ACC1J127_9FUNG|nr:hypothetical protein FBU59_005963 [Linderina macrospora]
MCKHILNAQQSDELVFICKKCKKAFRKDVRDYEPEDEYCPHCDNHYVIDAKTPRAALGVEGEDARMDNRFIKDDRVKGQDKKSIYAENNLDERLG